MSQMLIIVKSAKLFICTFCVILKQKRGDREYVFFPPSKKKRAALLRGGVFVINPFCVVAGGQAIKYFIF